MWSIKIYASFLDHQPISPDGPPGRDLGNTTPLIPTSTRRGVAEHPPSRSNLESSVESHRALGERSTDLLGERFMNARWDSTGEPKTLLLGERSLAARPLLAEHSWGLVV